MKALVQNGYKSIDAYLVEEVPKPEPKANEVLVKVCTTAINDWEFGVLNAPAPVRLLLGWAKPKGKFRIMGCDMAGRVEAVGSAVNNFKVGDDVFGDLSGYHFGGFAEYVCVVEQHIAHKPASMSFEQAAALPHAAELALQALQLAPPLVAGQKVLVNGAAGGVGSLLIQVLKQEGVETTGVDRAEKLEFMRALGYQRVIDYEKTNFTQSGETYDLIIDAKTGQAPGNYLRVLSPQGHYITVGGKRLLRFMWMSVLINRFSSKRLRMLALKPNRNLTKINEMFCSGVLRPVIDRVFTFEEIKSALTRFERAEHQGKIIIKISD